MSKHAALLIKLKYRAISDPCCVLSSFIPDNIMNTSFFMADDDVVSDFAFSNLSTRIPSGGGGGWYPGLKTLQDLVLWYMRLEVSISVVAAVFTTVVIVVIAKEKSFHSITNYFVANLMASDFVMAICFIIDGLVYREQTKCGGTIIYLQHVSKPYFLNL